LARKVGRRRAVATQLADTDLAIGYNAIECDLLYGARLGDARCKKK